jgi:hypothetical protein
MQPTPYQPPDLKSAGFAAGLAPLLVLALFVAVVLRWVAVDAAFAGLATSSLWVAWEMAAWQRQVDAYNARYVQDHLAWRSEPALRALAERSDLSTPTRDFVQRYVDTGCRWQPDRPQL